MNYTPEQIAEIVLKVLKEVNEPDVLTLSYGEKYKLAQNPNTPVEILKVLATDKSSDVRSWIAQNPNYKTQTIELTQVQYDALKVLLKSSQDESLKTLTL